MKKIISALLILTVVCSLSACDHSAKSSGGKDNENSVSDSESAIQNNSSGEKEMPEFEAITVIENDECSVTVTKIETGGFWGNEISVELENKSPEKNLMFAIESAAVNNLQCDVFFASEVASGKTDKATIIFSDESLATSGITEFTDIQLSFRIYDSDDWLADAVAQETIHIYPYGEDNAGSYIRDIGSADLILVDNEYCTIIVTGYDPEGLLGYTVDLFAVNKTDKDMMISAENVSINGVMIDPFYAEQIIAEKSRYSAMTFLCSSLEENGISDINEIEFMLKAYDMNDWLAEEFVNEQVQLHP